jgi:hypothetical protein
MGLLNDLARAVPATLIAAVLMVTLLWSSPAVACPVCASSAGPTVVQALQEAERAVLARLEADGRPRVIEVIKGSGAVGESLDLLIRPASQAGGPARPLETPTLVMVKSAAGGGWSLIGSLHVSRAAWLRSLAQLPAAASLSSAGWIERIQLFLPWLEDPEPLVAETAYGEISKAPYGAMRAVRDQLDGQRLARWSETTALADRRPLYLLLLGLSGTPEDAQRIERQLLQPSMAMTRPDLPALAAALLELGGIERLAWLETHWLLNDDRPVSLLQQVLVALSVHGGEQGRIPRQAIVQSYLRFIERRPRLGGLVAQDLATWRIWEATPFYARAIQLPDAPIASRVAMAQYLRVSPHPAARDALRQAIGR